MKLKHMAAFFAAVIVATAANATPPKSMSPALVVPKYDEVVVPNPLPPMLPTPPRAEPDYGPEVNRSESGLGGTVPLGTVFFYLGGGGGKTIVTPPGRERLR